MCGILGWYKFDEKKSFTEDQVMAVFDEMETRGMQASGFYSQPTGTVKDGRRATELLNNHKEELKKALGAKVFIGHTRAATSGRSALNAPVSDNNNNHPHESENFVLVHNGHFSSTPEVKDYKYNGNCDSEIPLSYLETFGIEKGIELLCKTDGFALAIVDKRDQTLYLIRHSNPTVYAHDTEVNALVFASTSDGVWEFGKEFWVKGIPRRSTGSLYSSAEDMLYKITSKGVVETKDIKFVEYQFAYTRLDDEIKSKLDIKEPKVYDVKESGRYSGYHRGYPDLWDDESYDKRYLGDVSPMIVRPNSRAIIARPVIRIIGPRLNPTIQYLFLRQEM